MYIPQGWELIWLSQQFHWVFHTFFRFFSDMNFDMNSPWPWPKSHGLSFQPLSVSGLLVALALLPWGFEFWGKGRLIVLWILCFLQASSRIAHPAWGGGTEFSTRCHISFVLFGGFHSHGESPIAGCLKKWKIRKKHGWVKLGLPPF